MLFDTCRMRQPMPNIAEHCTSPESFSNPQIDVGTSRNFSPSVTGFLIPTRKAQHGSIMSSESSIKAYLQVSLSHVQTNTRTHTKETLGFITYICKIMYVQVKLKECLRRTSNTQQYI